MLQLILLQRQFGRDFYQQDTGIPQGSKVSSLLCSYLYGHMEKHLLPFAAADDCVSAKIKCLSGNSADAGQSAAYADHRRLYLHYAAAGSSRAVLTNDERRCVGQPFEIPTC